MLYSILKIIPFQYKALFAFVLFYKCEKNMDDTDEYGRTLENTDFQKTTNMDGIWTEDGLKLDGVSVTFYSFYKKLLE